MNEDDNERLARAAMRSLKVSAPQSLKADLKRLARNRKPAPSVWAGLLDSLSGGKWAYGASAAFAAAAIAVVILRAMPERAPAPRKAAVAEPAVRALADMWADDSGEDNDEI